MEQLFTALGTGIGNTVQLLAESGALFVIFAGLWIAFGYAFVRRDGSLDRAWARVRHLNPLIQLLAWLLFLPVMAGLWIFERAWPMALRALMILALAGWNLLVFLPRLPA